MSNINNVINIRILILIEDILSHRYLIERMLTSLRLTNLLFSAKSGLSFMMNTYKIKNIMLNMIPFIQKRGFLIKVARVDIKFKPPMNLLF